MIQDNILSKQHKPRIIAIANQKGGVGKTTTAVNLATAISAIDKKVLIIDLDPQGNASVSVGLSRLNTGANAYSVLTGRRRLSDAVAWTKIPNLSLVPASLDLLGIDIEFAEEKDIDNVFGYGPAGSLCGRPHRSDRTGRSGAYSVESG